MILVFDLDDTLYDELSYVRSGLLHVASWVHEEKNIDPNFLYEAMEKALSESRSHIFDKAFQDVGCYSKSFINKAVRVYRTHSPDIHIHKAASDCLRRFSDRPKFLVTDGNKTVQNAKVKALKITQYFQFIYLTYRYGRKHAKPSPYCFLKICERTKTPADQIIYIADNPAKDFKGIKPLGFKTVRVLTGQHSQIKTSKDEDADHRIPDLSYLSENFLLNAWS